jgi:hypothetical protein
VHTDTKAYNRAQAAADRRICDLLADQIDRALPEAENKIWHRHPVWFLDGNPVVGYSKLKDGVRLLFWSGQSFTETGLRKEGRFKAAEARYTAADQVDTAQLARWLAEARDVQWDLQEPGASEGAARAGEVAGGPGVCAAAGSSGLRPVRTRRLPGTMRLQLCTLSDLSRTCVWRYADQPIWRRRRVSGTFRGICAC